MPLPDTPSGLLELFQRNYGSRELVTDVLQGIVAPFLDELPEEQREDITQRLTGAYQDSWRSYVSYKRYTLAIQSRMERIHRHMHTRRHTEEDIRDMEVVRKLMSKWIVVLWKAGVYYRKERHLVVESLTFLYSAFLDLRDACVRRSPDLLTFQVDVTTRDGVIQSFPNIQDALIWVWRELLIDAQADGEPDFARSTIYRISASELPQRILLSMAAVGRERYRPEKQEAFDVVERLLQEAKLEPNLDLVKSIGYYRPNVGYF